MITITRNLARQLRAVFRHALGTSPRGTAPAVMLSAGENGLHIRGQAFDAAVEYSNSGNCSPEEMVLPGEALADCEGRRDDPVTLERQSDGQICVTWRDAGVPVLTQYPAPDPPKGDQFPSLPTQMASNPPGLISALAEAMDTTDTDCSRFATDHVELRGKSGAIAATDGQQLLVESGFSFPWDDPILIPRSGVFASKDLPHDVSVEIGKRDEWVTIRVGPWTLHFKIGKDRRFPNLDNHIPKTDRAVARLQLAAADADFLARALPRLPCDDDYNRPVTLDMNGQVAIRACTEGKAQITELVLAHSTMSGDPVRFTTNRRFLARALKLGFRELLVYGPNAPIMCHGDGRQYVWALLDPQGALKPSDKAIRISSAESRPKAPAVPPQPRKRRSIPVSETTNTKNGSPESGDRPRTKKAQQPEATEPLDPIVQAEAVKTALRDAHAKVSELIVALKRHQKQFKIVHSTLSSLRQLKAIGA